MKRNRGSAVITTPIIIAIGIMIITMLIAFSVNIIMPYIWYEKLSSTAIKYIYVMEEYGYLTKTEVKNLKNELKNQGFSEENMSIGYTSTRVEYGNPIFLKVSYDYEVELPMGKNLKVPMVITRNSVSKR